MKLTHDNLFEAMQSLSQFNGIVEMFHDEDLTPEDEGVAFRRLLDYMVFLQEIQYQLFIYGLDVEYPEGYVKLARDVKTPAKEMEETLQERIKDYNAFGSNWSVSGYIKIEEDGDINTVHVTLHFEFDELEKEE